mmetsp:Transcript_83037/g.240249  ORF Transcript_83037/g.240249 Transcript_83037/m.240249 type:complete len:371 (-) Transcript_83037:1258-2370(-)
MVRESCEAGLVTTEEASTDVEQGHVKPVALGLVEGEAGSAEGFAESSPLRAAAPHVEAHAADLQSKCPRFGQQLGDILERSAILVRERALRVLVVRLHAQHQLGLRIQRLNLVQLGEVVEGEPSQADFPSVKHSRFLLARVREHHAIDGLVAELLDEVDLHRRSAIEAADASLLPLAPEGVDHDGVRVALHSVERLDPRQQASPRIDLAPHRSQVDEGDQLVFRRIALPLQEALRGHHSGGSLRRSLDFQGRRFALLLSRRLRRERPVLLKKHGGHRIEVARRRLERRRGRLQQWRRRGRDHRRASAHGRSSHNRVVAMRRQPLVVVVGGREGAADGLRAPANLEAWNLGRRRAVEQLRAEGELRDRDRV